MSAKVIEVRDRLEAEEAELVVEAVGRHGLLIFPTETVYGLGCAADDPEAIERLYHLKGRERGKPMALHLGDLQELTRYAIFEERERRWIARLLPGPYTLLLKASPQAPRGAVSAGKVGIRVPASRAFRALAAAADRPLLGTSANKSGEPPAVTPEDVIGRFAADVDLIIISRERLSGQSSAVLDLTVDPPRALRGELPRWLELA
ncbi:MAG: L-threonylcarbamoyladenylate synthase [Candidatus Acetothermia bacterium]|jgi:L-threonylcarbamoyladenylate synthase|nr:L-threonylcarbamoyladenylate synthase [Candidatus Acetothermia bacterium]MDH7504941.1 L-threonylcarbamoyladenylate synthase [Candidatus Acetothermia bacterium]